VDTDVFPWFLDARAKAVPAQPGVRPIFILDNASWHKAARLNGHHFEPKFLPGDSPDFNPMERLW
jgi:transposase